MLITQEYLQERFEYDSETGQLIWKTHLRKARYVGKPAGTKRKGYIYIYLDKKQQSAHRLVWMYHHGVIPDGKEIDHIDGNKTNNRIENLRLADRCENMWNREAKGYRFKNGKYEVAIRHLKKLIYLGRYDTEEEARAVYTAKRNELREEFTPC